MSNANPLTDLECDRLCVLWTKIRKRETLTSAEDAEFDQLRIRIKVIPWPPVIPPPNVPPPTIKIPVMLPASEIAGDPGVQGPIV
jgi:hypothetical protein